MSAERTITVNVLFFAKAREATGIPETSITLPQDSNTTQLVTTLLADFPALSDIIDSAVLAVNQEYSTDIVTLHNRDEVAIIPPVSGG